MDRRPSNWIPLATIARRLGVSTTTARRRAVAECWATTWTTSKSGRRMRLYCFPEVRAKAKKSRLRPLNRRRLAPLSDGSLLNEARRIKEGADELLRREGRRSDTA